MAETQGKPADAWALPERLLRFGALVGGFVLLGLVLLVSASVFARYVLNQPLLGDKELVEMGMALVVMMAMPLTTFMNGHIRVDILDERIGDLGRYVGDLFARVVSCIVLVLLVQKTWDKTLDAHRYGDVTNMIEIPVWIAYGAITFGMGLYAIVLATQLIEQFRRRIRGYE